MSEGDFKLELENATVRRLLELAATDAARRDSAEKLQRLILEELHHRVKNTLAIVQSITNQSVRTAVDLPHAGEAISARLGQGRVHDLLLRTSWAGAMLNVLNSQCYRQGMERSSGNVGAAARMLGLSRAQLAYRLKQTTQEM
jgi:two-component sensor histidine kinase